MAQPVIEVMGVDVFPDADKLFVIEQQKEFDSSKLTNNTYTFTLNNLTKRYALTHPASIFTGNRWLYTPVKVWDSRGLLVWNGILTNVVPNYNGVPKTALTTKSVLFQIKDTVISYKSSDWETPADVFKNVCEQEGFTQYNNASVSKSISAYTGAGCYLKANIKTADGQKMQNLFDKLSEIGNARVYQYNNEVYFEHWTQDTPHASLFIKDKDLSSDPVIEVDQASIYNQYNIGYCGDAIGVATASVGALSREWYKTKSLPDMSTGSSGEMIYFKNETSAQYIGNGYIYRGHKTLDTTPEPLINITFGLNWDFERVLSIPTHFKFTYRYEDWTDKMFELTHYSVDENTRTITVGGREVQ